jgi:hypothetical protein
VQQDHDEVVVYQQELQYDHADHTVVALGGKEDHVAIEESADSARP